jgi:hypothetical protein
LRRESTTRPEERKPDLVCDAKRGPPCFTIQSEATRISNACGDAGKGRYLDEYIGPRPAPFVMPIYHE